MTTTVTLNYGYQELRQTYQKSAFRSLFIAVVIHLSVLGSYLAVDSMFPSEIIRTGRPGGGVIWSFPPPSIVNSTATPRVSIASADARPKMGTPIPVPDGTVNPESTIPDQADLSKDPGSGAEDIEGTDIDPNAQGAVFNPEGEAAPPDFRAVEKQPVAIKSVSPVYPEIARRAGIEGTAWVRIWVGKDGLAKKAEVMKSDADLFNQPSIDAALQWVFTPAVMNSGPVSVWVAIPYRFRLNQNR